MTRGTTPLHRFYVDIDLTGAEAIYITYKQFGVTIEKTGSDISVTENYLDVALTQEETLAFSDRVKVEIQIRAKFSDGKAVASNIARASVHEILKQGAI